MKHFLVILTMLVVQITLLPGTAFGTVSDTPANINELVSDTVKYDQHVIKISGEVIGDKMVRGETGWININDGTNTIGVFATKKQLNLINFAGDYSTKGDTVNVEGIFYKADPKMGGDIYIKANRLVIVKEGGEIEHPLNRAKFLYAAILVILNILLTICYISKRRILKI